jgi:hypothetical protein
MRIDRLRISAPGLSEGEGRQLASEIAAQLAAAGGLPAVGDIPLLAVRVSAAHRVDVPNLAQRIVNEALQQLQCSI